MDSNESNKNDESKQVLVKANIQLQLPIRHINKCHILYIRTKLLQFPMCCSIKIYCKKISQKSDITTQLKFNSQLKMRLHKENKILPLIITYVVRNLHRIIL